MIETGEPAGVDEDELVPTDDRVIGRAFRWSMIFLTVIATIGTALFWVLRPHAEAPPVTPPQHFRPSAAGEAVAVPPLPFTDITAAAGIHFRHENGAYGEKLMPETMGSGCAFLDHDGDGDQDLLIVNATHWPGRAPAGQPAPTMALYSGDGSGAFTDVTAAVGLDRSFYGTGVAVADHDGDGDVDLFIAALGENHLFANQGGRFEEVTERAGVGGSADAWTTSAGFFDADGDGDLDLFATNYVRWTREIDLAIDFKLTGVGRAYGPPMTFEGAQSYFYLNQGDGTFVESAAERGMKVTNAAIRDKEVPVGKGLGVSIFDFDRDGWLDVFVANDTTQNFLFRNLGAAGSPGHFEEVGTIFGVAYDRAGMATGAMGCDAAYLHNDATLGLAIGNFANEMTSLYSAESDPTQYVDLAASEGVGAPSRLFLKFGIFFFDCDLDGRLDLLETNGHIEDEIAKVQPSQTYEQPAQLFWNAGRKARVPYVEAPSTGDLARPIVGRSSSYADIDGDGDLDVVLTQTGGPVLLLRNDQQQGHHWLRVSLKGRAPNTGAIGATVTLVAAGITQRREVMPTRSYLAQVELPVTFGLGAATTVDKLTITWPNGPEQTVKVESVDTTLVVAQE